MKSKSYKSNIIVHLFFLLFCTMLIQEACAATVKETFKKTISFAPGGFLSLSNSNGNVTVVAWERDEVEIIAHKQVKSSDRDHAEDLLKKLVIDVREQEGEIIIETEFPNTSGSGSFFGWLFADNGNSFSVQYEIKVPGRIDLNLSTTNGNMEVEEITGRLKLESTNGQISGREISGLARCKTTNGSIKVAFRDLQGDDKLTFKSTNGSIKLYFPDDFAADVDLKTTNGRIKCDFPMSGHQSRTRFSGTIRDSRYALSCQTTNGNIGLYKR